MSNALKGIAILSLGSLAPLAASAQDAAVCSGVPEGRWVGADAAQSDVATADAPFDVTTFVPVGGGAAVSQFTLSAPAQIRYEAKGSFGGDPIAWLYDAAGNEVSMNDDGAVDFAVRAETDLTPGDYCLKVADVNNGLLPVEIRIGRSDQEALTESVDQATYAGGSRCENAEESLEISLDAGSYAESFPVGRDVGLWFDLAEPRSLTIEAIGQGNDPLLYLEDADGNYISENDDSDGLDARIDLYAPLQPGRYCAVVSTYEEDGSIVDVSIQTLDEQEAMINQIRSGAMSPLAGSDYPMIDLGVLNGRIVRDINIQNDYGWFSLDVEIPSLVRIDALIVDGSDPTMVLFDDAGRELARNDDWDGGDFSSRVLEELMPGTYMVGVSSVNGASERSRLVVDQFVRVK